MTDHQDKSEQATPHKLEEARKKGMVPNSPELLSLALLAGCLVVVAATAGQVATVFAKHTHWWLQNAAVLATSPGFLVDAAGHSLKQIAYALTPLVAAIMILAVLINVLFKGFVLSAEPMKPDFKRLNPVNGLKKIFSRRTLVELVKLLIKGLLFAFVLMYVVKTLKPDVLTTAFMAPQQLPAALLNALLTLGFALLFVMAVAAVWDMWYGKKDFARQMKMSRRELKDEYRRREGDPEIRAKRKGAQQELIKKLGALGKVKDADVIITNPTHIAVALQYRPQKMAVPTVIAVGHGLIAKQVCRLARQHRVPIIRRPPLARSLYRHCRVNDPIPPDAQADVATVYRWVIAMPGNKVVTR